MVPTIYKPFKPFTLTLSTVLTLFVGLSHVPHTCKHVQCAQYMQTHPEATALHTATDKQQNLTLGGTAQMARACPRYNTLRKGA